MKLDELLVCLNKENIGLRRSGSELTIIGDSETLTAALISELRKHKSQLLTLIEDGDTWWSRPVTITPEMLPLVRLTQEEIERIVETVPTGAGNVQDIYPLAPLQEGILFHHLMGGENDPYIVGRMYSFDSRQRLERYLEAMQAVIDRHDILRTGVVWEGLSEPVQVVWRQAVLPVEEVELEAGAGDGAGQLRQRYNPRSSRMDVRRAPMLQVVIARDEEKDRWLMMMLQHHLIGDHVTTEVMQEEIEAYLLGRGDSLPAPQPFRNLVAQARLGMSREEHEAYFRELLGDVEEPTAPFGLLNVQGDGTGIAQARITLEAGLASRIRESARKLGVSAASLWHVAWGQVAGRTSGRKDVVFGTVLFGRMQGGEGAEQGMGLFMNTLPMRMRVGEQGAEESVREVQRQLGELMRHEHASLALAQRCSGVPAPAPLFTSLLNYRHNAGAGQASSEEKARAWEGIKGLYAESRNNYPVTLNIDDQDKVFTLTTFAEASVDAHRVCQYMHRALESLVEALESEPFRPLSALEVLPDEERQQLYEWNATEAEYPRERCVQELFEEQVERTPDAVAVVYEDATLSYAELNRQANQLAHYLRKLGVRPDDRVAICMERSLEMIVGLLGVLKAGGAYVPLDPAYPVERLQYMLDDSAPVALLTRGQTTSLFAQSDGPSILDLVEAEPRWREQPQSNPDRVGAGLRSEHLAYVIYTSGSTGRPKGVMVEHRQLINYVAAISERLGVAEGWTYGMVSTFTADLGHTVIYSSLLRGGALHVLPQAACMDGERFERYCQERKIDCVKITPTHFESLLGEDGGEERIPGRCLVFGGESLRPELVRRVRWLRPGCRIYNHYGPTECTVGAVADEVEEARAEEWEGVIGLGRPLGNVRVYVLDGNGEAVPVGVVGELYIGGAGVARGYLNRAEVTAERFVSDPFAVAGPERMYKTGDLGRWKADGTIEFLGRNDFQVKVRGYRVEPGEIEASLREHEGVREAVVLACEDTTGEKRLVAYYTVVEEKGGGGEGIGAEELRQYLSAKLPEYMAPAAYVYLEKLPLTPNGKLDRKALPAPETEAYGARDYDEPVGEIERAVAEIWADVLKVERVSRHDNFFELGGHSLMVIRVVSQLRRAGLEVDVRALFTTPVLAELAAEIAPKTDPVEVPPNGIPAGCEAITPEMLTLVQLTAEEIEKIVQVVPGGAANVQDIYPLAPLQEGILFHHLMEAESDPYILGSLYSFDSRQRLESYLEAMQAVIDRHDILRTGVVWEGLSEPVQVVWRKAVLAVDEAALEVGAGDGARQLRELYNPQSYRMDVRRAPMLRVAIAHDEEKGRWLMMLLQHHLIGDHVTTEAMQEEMEAYLLGRKDRLPVPQPFRNLVAQARLGMSREEHEAYFRELLGDVEEPTAPFGLLNVQGGGTGITNAYVKVETVLGNRIREQARRLGVGAASLWHVAWGQVAARTSGREDVVFGTVLFGRMQGGEGAEQGMGLFMNTLPMRIRVGEQGAEESVRGAQRQLGELMHHEHASLALAQRCSGVPAPAPLFTSLLNYRHSTRSGQASLEEKARAWEGIQRVYGYGRTNYPVALSVDDLGEIFTIRAEVETPIDAHRVCQYIQMALESLVTALDSELFRPLSALEVLPEAERCQLLYEWNATEAEYPRDRCVHELFEGQADKTPDAVAIVFQDETLSYGELNRRANRLAHYLRELGVGPDQKVALSMERSVEMVVGLLGVLKAGGAYVPLDPAYPMERLRYMLDDSEPVVLLTRGHLPQQLTGIEEAVPIVDLIEAEPRWTDRPGTNPKRIGAESTEERLAYVIYTSGSTGTPKGVGIEHRNVVSFISWAQQAFTREDLEITLSSTSLNFDLAVFECLVPLTVGGTVRIVTDALELVSRPEEVTLINTVPSAMAELVKGSHVPTTVRVVNLAGEPLKRRLVEEIFEKTDAERVCNLYGPSETTTYSTWVSMRREEGFAAHIGRPIANTRVYILNNYLEPAPVGVIGEIYIGGSGVARGYLNRADQTAERFLRDPYAEKAGARMYQTGDLGRWRADGRLELVGRNDFQVKIRGFRIELGEIEAKLEAHAGVDEVVVIARDEGEDGKRLVAYYTGQEIAADELRGYLSSGLPQYMVPSAYLHLDVLPLTPNGKLDRKALPTPEWHEREYRSPRTPQEKILCALFAEVLRLERVGIDDNFFELGGHSLLAMRLISRVRAAFGVDLFVRSLFEAATVEQLADIIEDTILDEIEQIQIPPEADIDQLVGELH